MRIFKLLSIILLVASTAVVSTAARAYAGLIEDTFKAINKKDWKQATNLAGKSKDTALIKIVLAQQLQDDQYEGNNFVLATNFLYHNPDWAYSYQISTKAESYINADTDPALIYKWFNKNKPITGDGYKHYAYAAEKVSNDPAAIIEIIKDGWRYGTFNKTELHEYRQRFGRYLDDEDNIARVDNKLMQERITEARETMDFLPRGFRDSCEAQIALIRKTKDSHDLFRKVAKKYHTPGLIYQYLKSRKRDLPPVEEMVALIKGVIAHSSEYGNKFFDVQSYMAREYIEYRQYRSAYKMISSHFATSKSNASDAEFLSGWLALRFLNKPNLAKRHFEKFDAVVGTPVSKARGQYWLGRTYLVLGNKEQARNHFREASNKYPYTFYGQAAATELPNEQYKLPANINLSNYRNDKYYKSHDLFTAAQLACTHGHRGMGQVYLKAAAVKAKEPNKIYALAYEYEKLKNVHYRVWFAKMAISQNVFIRHLNYPTPYSISHLPTEGAFTYSIIRQESVFDQYAISYANAYGLMQLIKPTACTTAKTVKLVCDVSKLTLDAKYNLTLGSIHLNDLVQEYQGSYILSAAAYNAGPVVKKWLNTYGDPRKYKHHHDVIDWLELIPYVQTRDYVQRVLENLQVYRTVLQKSPALRLSEELLHRRRL